MSQQRKRGVSCLEAILTIAFAVCWLSKVERDFLQGVVLAGTLNKCLMPGRVCD